MSDLEEDQPRFQGSDDDGFQPIDCIVYDQAAGEKMAERITDLQQQLKQREWISVDDRLPEDCVTVLVHGGCAHYSKANGKWYTMMERLNNGDYRQISWIVTQWMPLPTPPKEQEQ